jgi:hypothetical protein
VPGDGAARREREQPFHAVGDFSQVVEVLEEAEKRRDQAVGRGGKHSAPNIFAFLLIEST